MSVRFLLASIPHTAISGAFTASYLCTPLVLLLVSEYGVEPRADSGEHLAIIGMLALALAVWRQSHLHVFVAAPSKEHQA